MKDSVKRRTFLKSLGAISLVPALPTLSLAKIASTAKAAAPAVDPATYQWAEMIVRAHNQSTVGMLQRLLKLEKGMATALQKELVSRGVLVAQANEFGIHTAVKPLYEGAFVKPSNPPAVETKAPQPEADIVSDMQEEDRVMALMLEAGEQAQLSAFA